MTHAPRTPPSRQRAPRASALARFACLLVVTSCVSACDREEPAPRTEPPATEQVQSPEGPAPEAEAPLPRGATDGTSPAGRAWLEDLRAGHAAADDAATDADKAQARDRLVRAFDEAPPKALDAGEVTQVRQDLAARTGRLELELGRAREALAWSGRGLELSTTPSVFRSNLLLLQADAYEALSRPEDARKTLLRALRENQALLDEELKNP